MKRHTYLEDSWKINIFYKLMNLAKDVSSGRILGYLGEYKREFGLWVKGIFLIGGPEFLKHG